MKENKLIAEFMGFTQEKNIGWYDNDMLMSQNVYDSQDGNCFNELLFHNSWDWLMPVIGKCYQEHNRDAYFIQHNKHLLESIKNCDIDKAHQIVVDFIKNQSN